MNTNELKNLLTKYVSNPFETQVFVNYDNDGPIVVGCLGGFYRDQDKFLLIADENSEIDSMTVAEIISLLDDEEMVPVFINFLDGLQFELKEVDFEMVDEGEIILIGSEFDEE
jgi:hypothetical protein